MTYIFDHIPKTAGSTFNLSYLPAAFQPHELAIVPGDAEPNRKGLEWLATLPQQDLSRFRVIAGHHTGQLRLLFPEVRWLTLVRDPAQRVISSYLHARFHPGAQETLGKEIEDNRIGLGEYVQEDWLLPRSNELGSLQNLQAKILMGPEWESSLAGDSAAITTAIQSRFYLSGYTEAFELFLFYLHVTEGFPLVLFHNRLVRKERQTFRPTAEDLATIEHYNQADRIVYDCVRQEFARRLAEIWTTERSRVYDNYLRALREFQQTADANINTISTYSSR